MDSLHRKHWQVHRLKIKKQRVMKIRSQLVTEKSKTSKRYVIGGPYAAKLLGFLGTVMNDSKNRPCKNIGVIYYCHRVSVLQEYGKWVLVNLCP